MFRIKSVKLFCEAGFVMIIHIDKQIHQYYSTKLRVCISVKILNAFYKDISHCFLSPCPQ